MSVKDRRARIRADVARNGIDYVEIASADQKTLRVHFLNGVVVPPLAATPTITGGTSIPSVPVSPPASADFSSARGHLVLTLRTANPGDFSTYTLTINSPALDPYFRSARFSFRAGCPTRFEAPAAGVAAAESDRLPHIDYRAKDYQSFRQALLDYSAQRFPAWVERSEADFGIMFLEALSAVADDLSYYQDRIAAEATLTTATERRSIVRHARLVDYEPRPSLAASTILIFEVDAAITTIASGALVSARAPDGAEIPFETGLGLIHPETGLGRDAIAYPVLAARNALELYCWDDADSTLTPGATETWVRGRSLGLTKGMRVVLEEKGGVAGDQPRRELIQLVEDGFESSDPVFLAGGQAAPVTRLRWSPGVRQSWDLANAILHGNIIPATQGRTVRGERFAIPGDDVSLPRGIVKAISRTGPRGDDDEPSEIFLYTLAHAPLAWSQSEPADAHATPEFLLEQLGSAAPNWRWRRILLEADRFETAFTLDPMRYVALGTNTDGSVTFEYAGDDGDTLRFGDGTFSEPPLPGTLFSLSYRVGAGAAGNVAADSITRLPPATAGIRSVTNPFAAAGGADPEPLERVQRQAPHAFRDRAYRCVRQEDYCSAAEELGWVQRAGTTMRWTGSWLTVSTSVDPLGGTSPSRAQQVELQRLLDRHRLAGVDVICPPPRFAALDLEIAVNAQSDAFSDPLAESLLKVLSAAPGGYFDPDRFTFGTPLYRSAIESAIQQVPGVCSVRSVNYRRRGMGAGLVPMPDVVPVGADEVILVANDPNRPEHGALKVRVVGGK